MLDSIILLGPVIVVAFALRAVVGFGDGLLDFVILLCVVCVLTVLWGWRWEQYAATTSRPSVAA